ncbi:hypothetical protein JCM9157_2334 [Halalkalibacter akibai JCM 9157]|uniref:SGNH hydrolase-type esterase domain-containing protein n=1 Tax=Halalkalibacter akibai (strain ATCC 43226 / DSM 21942 / CIP 109018 / JCM 9157 / 1139) TaxID=1236973 RepID=W4QSX1_HALA3|nr:hypothetical protein JCM9157_2334 [Halalkalibacter akibai JCM 9157]
MLEFGPENHVYIDEYEKTLEKLIVDTKPNVKGIILMTPFYLELNEEDLMRRTMDRYGDIVRRLASTNKCVFVDTQSAFNEVLKDLYPATLAWDRVHPTTTGHMILAREILHITGFNWERI